MSDARISARGPGAIATVITTAMIFGLCYGLSAPLIALDLAERRLPESFIGLNAAMHAIGVLLIAPALPRLAERWGVRRLILGALLLAAAVLPLFPFMPMVWLWFPLRLLLGIASETIFVLSETWLNELADEATRARTMATYTAAMALGFALGPLILSAVGTEGSKPYLIGAVLPVLAFLFVVFARARPPAGFRSSHTGLLACLRQAPVAAGSTLLNAAVETAGLSLLPLYAMSAGWSERSATLLVAVMMVGAIVLQLPIGWLGDRMDRRRLIILLAVFSTVGAAAWPLVLHNPWLSYPLIFAWGGGFVGIYTLTLAAVGSRFSGSALVGLYAGLSVVWGGGALAGPALAGVAMDHLPHGLPLFVGAACLGFTLFTLRSRPPL